MKDYSKEVDKSVDDSMKILIWFIPIIVSIIVFYALFFGLGSFGKLGSTMVERKVFEQSYQRNEALNSALSTFQAQLTEIDKQLLNPNLDPNTKYNLEAQRSAINVRINATKGKM